MQKSCLKETIHMIIHYQKILMELLVGAIKGINFALIIMDLGLIVKK